MILGCLAKNAKQKKYLSKNVKVMCIRAGTNDFSFTFLKREKVFLEREHHILFVIVKMVCVCVIHKKYFRFGGRLGSFIMNL